MEAIRTIGKFLSSDHQTELTYTTYLPQSGEPSAILQVSHGMCEYFERYRPLAEYFCARGIAVCGHDHLGHGTAAQENGTLGFFAEKNGWRIVPEDVHRLTVRIKELLPEKPVFLLGHSMGSFVVRNVLTKYGTDYAGTVIMGTSGKNPMARLAIPIASIIKWMKGGTYRSRFLKDAGFSGFNNRFPDDSSENAWITGDKAHRDRYDADPLCTFTFTVSAYLDLYRMLTAVSSEKWARSLPKDLPVLLISGADDPLGKYGEGVRQVYHWLKGAGMRDVSIELVEKGRHEILNDFCRSAVLNSLYAFIGRNIVV